jgi:hypothetical protein
LSLTARCPPSSRLPGYWELSGAVAAAVGLDIGALEAAAHRGGASTAGLLQVFATELVLAVLERRLRAHEDEWAALAKKARKWLVKAGATAEIAAEARACV